MTISRIKIVRLFFLVLFFAVTFRLFYWQIYKGRALSVFARSQHQSGKSVDAYRGEIFTSDENWLVASGEAWILSATLAKLDKPTNEIAEELAAILIEDDLAPPDFRQVVPKTESPEISPVVDEVDQEMKKKEVLLNETKRLNSLLSKDGSVWTVLKNKVTPTEREKIENLHITGLVFEPTERREYPEGSGAAHLLGFVGRDSEGRDKGYFGLEGYYDVILSGKTGYLSGEQDAVGTPLMTDSGREIKAISGTSILTNIDKSIQLTLDKKIQEGVEKYGALSGTVIVMDPKTGAVLGMSAAPTYEPSKYAKYSDSLFLNPMISSAFEPGSVFKVLVMAAALDSGVITTDTKCDICGGPVKIDGYSIETWNRQFHPDSRMVDVIVNSDNVGMVFTSQKLGIDKMYDYLTSYGIGEMTGVDLQGEASPKLRRKSDFRNIDLATAGFGQGIAVTPIQMIRAVSAIANKGEMVQPQVVKKLIGDNWEEEVKPKATRRVISQKAAGEVTAMMYEAASKGESKWTYLKGYKVAGKTGTAQIPIAGHYDEKKTVASFVGFAPYDDPEFIMLVTLQEPQSSEWASETAAPLWYDIARSLFMRFGIQPEN